MTSEDPKHRILESLDISAVKDGDEILEVRFECGKCGQSIQGDVLPEAPKGVLWAISNDRCPNIGCREYSGFQYTGNRAETPDELKELAALLAENPRHPSHRARTRISDLLRSRNLRLRF